MGSSQEAPPLSPRGQKSSRDMAEILGVAPLVPSFEGPAQQLHGLISRMDRYAHDRDAPVREILARLGDRWSTLLLLMLRAGPFRHATLRRLVKAISAEGDISQRMLTLRLRALERDGLVQRDVQPTVPPRVSYSLTPLGLELTGLVDMVLGWLEDKDPLVRAARDAFARREAEEKG